MLIELPILKFSRNFKIAFLFQNIPSLICHFVKIPSRETSSGCFSIEKVSYKQQISTYIESTTFGESDACDGTGVTPVGDSLWPRHTAHVALCAGSARSRSWSTAPSVCSWCSATPGSQPACWTARRSSGRSPTAATCTHSAASSRVRRTVGEGRGSARDSLFTYDGQGREAIFVTLPFSLWYLLKLKTVISSNFQCPPDD